MFVNEYEMNRKRFAKWAVPKFWRTPIFYVYLAIFCVSVFGLIYFRMVGAPNRWQTLAACLIFVAVYRGVFFRWMHADKTFRLTRQKYFNEKDWMCKVIVGERNISLYINGKLNNKVEWDQICKCEEAKSYYKLAVAEENDGVMLDKGGFTEGDSASFRQWLTQEHPEIEITPIAAMFDR